MASGGLGDGVKGVQLAPGSTVPGEVFGVVNWQQTPSFLETERPLVALYTPECRER